MKNSGFLIVLVLACIRLYAGEPLKMIPDESEPYNLAYTVVSDEYDASLRIGSSLVEGTVRDFSSGETISSVQYSTDKKEGKFCDSKGYFRVVLHKEEQYIKFSKIDYRDSYFEDYQIRDRHRIKIRVMLSKEQYQHQYDVKKPVLYLYSDEEKQVDIHLNATGELFFTYPQIKADLSWKVNVKPNGMISDQKGQAFPYLFWESRNDRPVKLNRPGNTLSGSVIRGSEATAFLEDKLTQLGLNDKEKTDFITFWAPQLVSENYLFMQFLVDEGCNQFATYEISPEPEHFQRVYLVYSTFKEKPVYLETTQQEFKAMDRSGFHILEWGGMNYQFEAFVVAD